MRKRVLIVILTIIIIIIVIAAATTIGGIAKVVQQECLAEMDRHARMILLASMCQEGH